jgi:hypothetical protein
MPQFHETGYGQKFFNQQLPDLTKAIDRLTGAIEASNSDEITNAESTNKGRLEVLLYNAMVLLEECGNMEWKKLLVELGMSEDEYNEIMGDE